VIPAVFSELSWRSDSMSKVKAEDSRAQPVQPRNKAMSAARFRATTANMPRGLTVGLSATRQRAVRRRTDVIHVSRFQIRTISMSSLSSTHNNVFGILSSAGTRDIGTSLGAPPSASPLPGCRSIRISVSLSLANTTAGTRPSHSRGNFV
jgi:hypothetical protein